MGPPDYNAWLIAVLYVGPYLIGFIMPGRKVITYFALCFLVYDLSWRFMPAGFILPWFLIPFAGSLRYFTFSEPVVSRRLLCAVALFSIFLGFIVAKYLITDISAANVHQLAESTFPSVYILPTFLSGVFSGNPYFFNQTGYFLGLWAESIIFLTYCLAVVLAFLGIGKKTITPKL